MVTLRFTRAVFGVIQEHLESWRTRFPDSVDETSKSLYVDDLISGASTVTEAKQLKTEATEIFNDTKFELHKWHSNVPELETACEN